MMIDDVSHLRWWLKIVSPWRCPSSLHAENSSEFIYHEINLRKIFLATFSDFQIMNISIRGENLILTKGVWFAAFPNHSWEAWFWKKVQLSSHPTQHHHHHHNNRIIVNIIITTIRPTGCLLNRVVSAAGGKRRRTEQGCYFGYHEPSGGIMMTMMVILVMIMAMMVSIHTKSRGELSKAATSDIMNLQVGWSLWCWCIWLWRWWSL